MDIHPKRLEWDEHTKEICHIDISFPEPAILVKACMVPSGTELTIAALKSKYEIELLSQPAYYNIEPSAFTPMNKTTYISAVSNHYAIDELILGNMNNFQPDFYKAICFDEVPQKSYSFPFYQGMVQYVKKSIEYPKLSVHVCSFRTSVSLVVINDSISLGVIIDLASDSFLVIHSLFTSEVFILVIKKFRNLPYNGREGG